MSNKILKFIITLLFLNCNFALSSNYKYDLTVLGEINYDGGLTRIGLSIVECLHPYLKINYIRTPRGKLNLSSSISEEVKSIIKNVDTSPGKVAFFVDTFDNFNAKKIYKPIQSKIKIAYTMLESTLIPKEWVNEINLDFDAVVVPDDFLVKVYKDSGVMVPIFVLPLCMYLDDFLTTPIKSNAHTPFTFGVAATFINRKNNLKLFQAFVEEFGNDENFLLKMHGRYGYENDILRKKIKKMKIRNVKICDHQISQQQYIKFLKSLDCYVYISKGEGFSLTPREAMALGIPCILTDNTAQSTICKSDLVESIPSNIKQDFWLRKKKCGFCFDCDIKDVKKAMRKIYTNYSIYLSKSLLMRKWVKKYCIKSLSKHFLMLIKPTKIILGDKNVITKSYMMTDSIKLYQKFKN